MTWCKLGKLTNKLFTAFKLILCDAVHTHRKLLLVVYLSDPFGEYREINHGTSWPYFSVLRTAEGTYSISCITLQETKPLVTEYCSFSNDILAWRRFIHLFQFRHEKRKGATVYNKCHCSLIACYASSLFYLKNICILFLFLVNPFECLKSVNFISRIVLLKIKEKTWCMQYH